MAKMYFPTKVKYNGTNFPANVPFEVADKDVENLKTAGGWLIAEPEKPETPVKCKARANKE